MGPAWGWTSWPSPAGPGAVLEDSDGFPAWRVGRSRSRTAAEEISYSNSDTSAARQAEVTMTAGKPTV